MELWTRTIFWFRTPCFYNHVHGISMDWSASIFLKVLKKDVTVGRPAYLLETKKTRLRSLRWYTSVDHEIAQAIALHVLSTKRSSVRSWFTRLINLIAFLWVSSTGCTRSSTRVTQELKMRKWPEQLSDLLLAAKDHQSLSSRCCNYKLVVLLLSSALWLDTRSVMKCLSLTRLSSGCSIPSLERPQ